jgi:hypothetical protein
MKEMPLKEMKELAPNYAVYKKLLLGTVSVM